jgi:formate hydrogenlyase subunit 3/multisubunit Na+/H+ antiporter MnhD subunit
MDPAILHRVIESRFIRPAAIRIGTCVVVVAAALLLLATGGLPRAALPIGFAGMAINLALDPLAASFLLLIPCVTLAPLPLVAMVVILSAANGFTLAIGLLLLGGIASLRSASTAAICCIVALVLAGSVSDFAAIRAMPPDGWRAAAVLLLTLAGAAATATFSPVMAIYVLIRLLFDLCGTAQPLWWGVPLLLAGAGIAMVTSLRGALADWLDVAVWQASLHQVGLAVIGLGVALCARGVDLPSVASHALDGAWLAIACHALCRALLLRCADAVESGAGTRRLDLLGGVIHRMPMTTGGCLIGLFTIAVLPPGLGFAAFWLVFQSLVAAARIGSFGLGLLVAVVTLLTGASAGLAALAAMRVATVVFLGRPRTPRAAAADEVARPAQLVLVGLAALLGLLGVFPVLALLPAFRWGDGATAVSLFGLRTGFQTEGYAATFVAVFVTSAWIGLAKAIHRPRLGRREPDWSGGFSPPPVWMPFGDPTTQCGPASFVAPLQSLIARLPSTDAARQRLAYWRDRLLRAIAARMAT